MYSIKRIAALLAAMVIASPYVISAGVAINVFANNINNETVMASNETIEFETFAHEYIFATPETTKEVETTTEAVTVVEEQTTEIVTEEPTTKKKVKKKSSNIDISKSDIDLIALVTIAEAEGESEKGKRLVIDTVLNRMDRNKQSAYEIIYAKNQYVSMTNGRSDRCKVTDKVRKLVREEIKNRTNYDVLYFRTNHYHNFGTPICKVGSHYFSGR